MSKVLRERARPSGLSPAGEIVRRGMMFVLSSPSGAGKSTISRTLLARDEQLTISVSVTTRAPRPGEADGRDYVFVDAEEFERLVADDGLLEHAVVFGNHYGTPREPVEAALAEGCDILFDVDWQGTQQLKQNAGTDVITVFVLPPSYDELERRLLARGQDPEHVVRQRMAKAADEISHWAEYDYIVVNRDLDLAVDQVQAILTAERLRRRRQIGLTEFVKSISAK